MTPTMNRSSKLLVSSHDAVQRDSASRIAKKMELLLRSIGLATNRSAHLIRYLGSCLRTSFLEVDGSLARVLYSTSSHENTLGGLLLKFWQWQLAQIKTEGV